MRRAAAWRWAADTVNGKMARIDVGLDEASPTYALNFADPPSQDDNNAANSTNDIC